MSFPLNPEQLEATKWRRGPVVIQACPGAGKTRTLVELVNGLLEEGYPADKIVAMTFTREAAEEMASRAGLSEEQRIFRTFHSFCLDLIHKEARYLPFQLTAAPPEAGQQRKLLGSICRANRIDFKQLTGFISNGLVLPISFARTPTAPLTTTTATLPSRSYCSNPALR